MYTLCVTMYRVRCLVVRFIYYGECAMYSDVWCVSYVLCTTVYCLCVMMSFVGAFRIFLYVV